MSHIPERMCIGCRKMFAKNELVRLVAADDGIAVDKSQKMQTRGAYICKRHECISAARKKKALSRQFKRNVGDAVYDMLLEMYPEE